MKHLTHIILLSVVLSLFGCSDRRATSVLNHADSLLSTCPDTVLVMLDSLRAERSSDMSRRQKMRLELLRADAQNKSYVNFTTDSVMREVTAYYDAHGTAQERMRAHYLLGCTYRDMGDAPRALECYHDAVSFADTTSADCDYKQLSRVYGQMAELFHKQRSPQFEKEALQQTIKYASKCKDILCVICCYEQFSHLYYMVGQRDSSECWSKYAYTQFQKHGYNAYSKKVLLMLMALYIESNDLNRVKVLIDEYEKYFSTEEQLNNGVSNYYYYKGMYYSGINKLDSAEFFYRKLLYKNKYSKNAEPASRGLMGVYSKLGKPDSVMKYAQMFADANDSACLVNSAEEINRANALYNYNINKRKAMVKEREADGYKNIIMVILLIVTIIFCVFYIYITRQRAKNQKVKETYERTLLQYNKVSEELLLLEEDESRYVEKKEREQQDLHLSLSLLSETEQLGLWNVEQDLLDSPVVRRLRTLVDKGQIASDKELDDFVNTMFTYQPDFCIRLKSMAVLTHTELLVCLLSKMNFKTSSIGVLLGLSKQRVSNIRSRANGVLFGQKGANSLNYNIRNL